MTICTVLNTAERSDFNEIKLGKKGPRRRSLERCYYWISHFPALSMAVIVAHCGPVRELLFGKIPGQSNPLLSRLAQEPKLT